MEAVGQSVLGGACGWLVGPLALCFIPPTSFWEICKSKCSIGDLVRRQEGFGPDPVRLRAGETAVGAICTRWVSDRPRHRLTLKGSNPHLNRCCCIPGHFSGFQGICVY